MLSRFHRSQLAGFLGAIFGLAALGAAVSGCGAGAGSVATATPISVAFANGSPTQAGAIGINGSVQLSMTPTGDVRGAGVDWTVLCGGDPLTGSITDGACGTFSPVHTTPGQSTLYTAPGVIPVGSNVTIVSTVTSNPSQNSRTVFKVIVPTPLLISLETLPLSMNVNDSFTLGASTQNDAATNPSINWTMSCGSSAAGACGSLNPATTASNAITTYTAPSAVPPGGTVTVTATSVTDPTRSASTSTTILMPVVPPPPGNVVITVLPASFYTQTLGTTHITKMTATVTGDTASKGVDWTTSCGSANCGTIAPAHTASGVVANYTAPTTVPAGGGTVTLKATSTADPTKSVTAIATVVTAAPITVTMTVPPPVKLVAGAAASLTGTTTNTLGINWTATCGSTACGSFSLSPAHTASGGKITYTAPAVVPAGSVVTIAASSAATTPANSAFATTTIQSPVVFTQAPPATQQINTSATLAATSANDPGNLGLNWEATCGGTACGSFTPSSAHTVSGGTIVYTAPSTIPTGDAVTITASSPATTPPNTASAFTTILTALTFTQPPPASLAGGTTATVAASLANDTSPHSIVWTVSCGNTAAGGCGVVTPRQTASGQTVTYTAPPVTAAGTTVSIIATSVADSSVNASASVAIVPNTNIAVNFIPNAPAQVAANTTVNLNAAVANDSTNAGVDWKICPSGCGFFTVKPATPGTTLPYTSPTSAVIATTVSGWPNGVPIPYTAPSQVPAQSTVSVVASAHADTTKSNSALIAITPQSGGAAVHGLVQAGTQPVIGASVVLYAAGTNGYASAASVLSNGIITDNNGSFTIPAGYTCPLQNNQVYLVATGGHVGNNAMNQQLALMTALGSCGAVGSSPVVVNEVTTVASAGAIAPFSANHELGGISSYLYIGTSSSNIVGLANAFAAVNNLVDISTGVARFTVPAGNAAAPYVTINTLADALNTCTSTSGGTENDNSPCGNLFLDTDSLKTNGLSNSSAPTDTLQAAFNIAQQPNGNNYGYSISVPLATLDSPYQPILTAQPNDWSLSLNYTSGGGLSAASTLGSFAVDAGGNLWITDTQANSVIEWNAVGAAISPSSGFPAGGGPLAIDATGNVWISGDNALTELTNLGTPFAGSPFAGVPGGGHDITIDTLSNLWISTGSGVAEFNAFGAQVSPSGGYVNDGILGTGSIATDSSNFVWVQNQIPGFQSALAQLSNPGGHLLVNSSTGGPSTPDAEIAPDASGDIWFLIGDQVCKMPPYGGTAVSSEQGICIPGAYAIGQNGFIVLTKNAQSLALDGAGSVWVASSGGQVTLGPVIPPSVTSVVPSLIANIPVAGTFASQSLAVGPKRVAVDGSGNIWVLLQNNTITEYIGLAVPVVQPLALGLKNKKIAAKP